MPQPPETLRDVTKAMYFLKWEQIEFLRRISDEMLMDQPRDAYRERATALAVAFNRYLHQQDWSYKNTSYPHVVAAVNTFNGPQLRALNILSRELLRLIGNPQNGGDVLLTTVLFPEETLAAATQPRSEAELVEKEVEKLTHKAALVADVHKAKASRLVTEAIALAQANEIPHAFAQAVLTDLQGDDKAALLHMHQADLAYHRAQGDQLKALAVQYDIFDHHLSDNNMQQARDCLTEIQATLTQLIDSPHPLAEAPHLEAYTRIRLRIRLASSNNIKRDLFKT